MKSEYEFDFTTIGFRFEKDHSYTGTLINSPPPPVDVEVPEEIKVDFKIQRDTDRNENDPNIAQSGKLLVTIPFRYKGMEEYVYGLVQAFTQQIHLNCSGKFNVDLACYLGREIPENEEEANELGDRPNFGVIRLIEDVGDPIFDSKSFVENSSNIDPPLAAIFNHAFREENPVDKFLSYFKIIEDFVYQKKQRSIKQQLLENGTIKSLFESLSKNSSVHDIYDDFIESIVQTRHECAHLKRKANFGFQVGDLRLKKVMEEDIPMLETISYKLVFAKE